jgi:hypothetical protein
MTQKAFEALEEKAEALTPKAHALMAFVSSQNLLPSEIATLGALLEKLAGSLGAETSIGKFEVLNFVHLTDLSPDVSFTADRRVESVVLKPSREVESKNIQDLTNVLGPDGAERVRVLVESLLRKPPTDSGALS